MIKYFISYSGGLGSAVSAIIAHENGLDYELIFADTLIEDEDLYRFNDDLAKALNKEIITLTDGRTPWEVYKDKRYIGNTRMAHCSVELKANQVRQYLEGKEGILVLGMDWSELDRIEKAKKNWAPRGVMSLLVEYSVTRADFEDILARYGLVVPRLYKMGFSHNNCGGFCCKAGLKQFKLLLETKPDEYMYHERQMERTMAEIGPTAKPFLRYNKGGTQKYITLKEFREDILNIEVPQFDNSGCGCFTDD